MSAWASCFLNSSVLDLLGMSLAAGNRSINQQLILLSDSKSLEQAVGRLGPETSKCQASDSDSLGLFPHVYLSESHDASQGCLVAQVCNHCYSGG